MFGSPAIDIVGKGIIECVEGCSETEPSSYIVFSGEAWIETGDTIVQSRILQVDGAFITDVAGNQIDTYDLNPAITARVSDFAMVEGPTPEPTPLPASQAQESPYVRALSYDGTTVVLHLSEPVTVDAERISDVRINVELPDGSIVQGSCIDPCDGKTAQLSFDVPDLSPSAIAVSFNFAGRASIRDDEDRDIVEDFEEVTLSQIHTVTQIDTTPLEMPGMAHTFWAVNVYFSGVVWIDGFDVHLRTTSGVQIPCYQCVYGPNGFGDLLIFHWTIDDLSAVPEVPDGDSIEEIVVSGQILSTSGLIANIAFEPVPFNR